MQITVRLHASLKKYEPAGVKGGPIAVIVDDGATVADVLARLQIPLAHAKMIVSNNEHLDATAVLRDGQHVDLYPPIAGGAP